MVGSAKLLIFGSDDSNMRYATQLLIGDPFIWIQLGEGKKAREYVLVSTLELGRAKQEAKRGIKVILWDKVDMKNIHKPVARKRNLADIAASVLLSYNITEIIVPENMWAVHLETLREHGLRPKIISPFFPQRVTKSQEEIAAIKRTGMVTKKAFKKALDILKKATIDWNDTLLYEGKRVTSEFLKNEMEKVFLEHGCQGGETIVACGEQAVQPHNRGSGVIHAGEPIVFDIFPRDLKSGYFFDMSRTVIKGTPTKEQKALYSAVEKAQLAGLAAVKPGRKTSEVHQACEAVFKRLGYKTTEEEGFIHSTGHGVGLDIHERPSVSTKSEEVLQPGMIITVEPGLYYKDLGGVRIEDTLLVTAKGYINLTNVPKAFIIK
jgi:Xaa-Pro aminopeptidase